jgi:bacteriorhodopsin
MPAWVPYLVEAAEEAEVGLINEESGAILVYANDISSMMLFASALIARHQNFGRLEKSLPETSESEDSEVGSKPSLDEYTLPLPFDRSDTSN